MGRQAEDDGGGAEHDHGDEHLGPDVGSERSDREDDRRQRRADRWRRAERPEPVGADDEDVTREDREHRDHPTEQHREQIERDRAEHEPVAAHVGQTFGHLPERAPRLERGAFDRADREQAGSGDREQRDADRIGQMRGNVIEDAADRRPCDRPALPCGRAQRDGLGQDIARHEVGGERAERGAGEGTGDAQQCRHREQDRQADDPGPGRPAEDQRAGQLKQDGGARDQPPVDAVGGPAADRGEQKQGHELGEPDQPELERRVADVHRLARNIVDLPADDDDHRHLRDRRGEPCDEISAKGGNAERFGDKTHALPDLI